MHKRRCGFYFGNVPLAADHPLEGKPEGYEDKTPRLSSVVRVLTQRSVEADAHQVEPVVLHVVGAGERVLAPLERFVGQLRDEPVVRLGVGGVHDGGVAFQEHKTLEP